MFPLFCARRLILALTMKLYELSMAGIGLLLTLCSLSAMAEDLVKANSMNYPAWVWQES